MVIKKGRGDAVRCEDQGNSLSEDEKAQALEMALELGMSAGPAKITWQGKDYQVMWPLPKGDDFKTAEELKKDRLGATDTAKLGGQAKEAAALKRQATEEEVLLAANTLAKSLVGTSDYYLHFGAGEVHYTGGIIDRWFVELDGVRVGVRVWRGDGGVEILAEKLGRNPRQLNKADEMYQAAMIKLLGAVQTNQEVAVGASGRTKSSWRLPEIKNDGAESKDLADRALVKKVIGTLEALSRSGRFSVYLDGEAGYGDGKSQVSLKLDMRDGLDPLLNLWVQKLGMFDFRGNEKDDLVKISLLFIKNIDDYQAKEEAMRLLREFAANSKTVCTVDGRKTDWTPIE